MSTATQPHAAATEHTFHAVAVAFAFAENFVLKDAAAELPDVRKSPLELQRSLGAGEEFEATIVVLIVLEIVMDLLKRA